MIKKCNTAHAKTPYSPYDAIYTSEFTPSQQNCPENEEDHPSNEELNFNITKIRQCKQQTEQFLTDMSSQLSDQHFIVKHFKEMYQKERQKSRFYRLKYHETMIVLRKKEEQFQSLQKTHENLAQRYEFIKNNSNIARTELQDKQQHYQNRIQRLEHQLEELQQVLTANMHQNCERSYQTLDEGSKGRLKGHNESTMYE